MKASSLFVQHYGYGQNNCQRIRTNPCGALAHQFTVPGFQQLINRSPLHEVYAAPWKPPNSIAGNACRASDEDKGLAIHQGGWSTNRIEELARQHSVMRSSQIAHRLLVSFPHSSLARKSEKKFSCFLSPHHSPIITTVTTPRDKHHEFSSDGDYHTQTPSPAARHQGIV